MPTLFSESYQARAARIDALVAKWQAKYRAAGISENEIDRIVQKRLWRRR